MPLYEDLIEIVEDQFGDPLVACRHCRQVADDRAQTDGDLPFLLMCPAGTVTLGEWATSVERTTDIAAFRRRHRT